MENLHHFKETGYPAMFLTLTYNDEHLPHTLDVDGAPVVTLRKKEFLKWVNNAQSKTTSGFRYYAIGEYGDLYGRPHYHMAVFPFDGSAASEIAALWKSKGFVQASTLNDQRSRYLANYTAKKLTKADDPRLRGNQEPEFRTSSRQPALGADFAESIAAIYQKGSGEKLLKERGDIERTIRIGQKIYPLSPFVLQKMRKRLGIPLLHRDRAAANPNYLTFHATQEASWNPTEAEAQEIKINAERQSKINRSTHQNL